MGLIERRGGSTALLRLGGLARLAPLLAVLFFVPAMNLAGIPPMSGFLGKIGLRAGLDAGTPLAYMLVAGGVVTSLLTLYAVVRTWSLAFWRTPQQAHEMAAALPEQDPQESGVGPGSGVVAHRGHIHVGVVTFAAHNPEEVRQAHDRDAHDRDLYQLLRDGELPARLPWSMKLPAMALIAGSLALTVLAGPLFDYTDRTAADLLQRDPYISTVLGEGR